jgi:hypothetical protein
MRQNLSEIAFAQAISRELSRQTIADLALEQALSCDEKFLDFGGIDHEDGKSPGEPWRGLSRCLFSEKLPELSHAARGEAAEQASENDNNNDLLRAVSELSILAGEVVQAFGSVVEDSDEEDSDYGDSDSDGDFAETAFAGPRYDESTTVASAAISIEADGDTTPRRFRSDVSGSRLISMTHLRRRHCSASSLTTRKLMTQKTQCASFSRGPTSVEGRRKSFGSAPATMLFRCNSCRLFSGIISSVVLMWVMTILAARMQLVNRLLQSSLKSQTRSIPTT